MSILGSLSTKGSNRAPSPSDARRKDIAKPLLVAEEEPKKVEAASPQPAKPIRPAEDFSVKNYSQSSSPNYCGIGGDGESASSSAGSPATTNNSSKGASSGEYSSQGDSDGSFSDKAGAKLSAIGEEVSGAFSLLGKKVSSLGSKIKTKVSEVSTSSGDSGSIIPATGGNPIVVSTDDVGKKDKLKETEVSLLDAEAVSPADESEKDPSGRKGGKRGGKKKSESTAKTSSSSSYSTTNYQQCGADYGGLGGGGDVSSKDDDIIQQQNSSTSPVSDKVKEKWSTLRSKVKNLIEDM